MKEGVAQVRRPFTFVNSIAYIMLSRVAIHLNNIGNLFLFSCSSFFVLYLLVLKRKYTRGKKRRRKNNFITVIKYKGSEPIRDGGGRRDRERHT